MESGNTTEAKMGMIPVAMSTLNDLPGFRNCTGDRFGRPIFFKDFPIFLRIVNDLFPMVALSNLAADPFFIKGETLMQIIGHNGFEVRKV
jgi:hypothetical protein